MTAKEYLSQLATIKRRIGFIEERIQELDEEAMSPKAIRYDKINVQRSPSGDAFADYEARKGKEIERLKRVKIEHLDKYTEIRKRIAKVTPPIFADVLYMRYVGNKKHPYGMKLQDIADKLDCAYETACRWHGKALEIFKKCNQDLFGH